MHVTDLALNKAMGMQVAAAGADHILELPETPLLLNHVGTIHASVQFALAEACSGEFLLGQLGATQSSTFAVLRTSEVKFRKPAHGSLQASARFTDVTISTVIDELTARGRALASISVQVADSQGIVTMIGRYDWFLQNGSGVLPGSTPT
jgi:acyl-coenzyme A thioesterase PaaI-like protein